MQEIKKRRIVIASVLKPVDDTRMFEKFGKTLAKKFEVHIFGLNTTRNINTQIALHGHERFNRLSFKRLFAPWKIAFEAKRLQPDYMVMTTHELLVPCIVLSLFSPVKLVYDIRENYALNILHTDAFPKPFHLLVAGYVRLKETICSWFVRKFIVAERVYLKQLHFVSSQTVVIENKACIDQNAVKHTTFPRKVSRFAFTGTLAASTGVFHAIKLIDKFHEASKEVRLTIAGHAALLSDRNRLKEEIIGKDYIDLIGVDTLVPHDTIIEILQLCDAGIIAYPPNTATTGRVPTKLFEYMALRLPVLATSGEGWTERIIASEAGIIVDLATFDPLRVLKILSETVFYPRRPADILWESEEISLFSVFATRDE